MTVKKAQFCHFRASHCHFYLHFKKTWWNNEAWVLRAERERKRDSTHERKLESEEKAGADNK